MTEKANKSRLLDFGLSTKSYKCVNQLIDRMKCYGVIPKGIRSLMTPSSQEKFLGLII